MVLSDEEVSSDPAPSREARKLSLDPRRQPGAKHRRDADSMSVDSATAKRADKTSSAEKSRR